MNIILWGRETERDSLQDIKRGLLVLQSQKFFEAEDIRILTGAFESYYGQEFAEADLLFVYFSSAGEEFCRFLITHRRYTEKTMFLFGQSYACFDSRRITDYYRVPEEEYLFVAGRKDYFYEAGLKQLLSLIRKRSMDTCRRAG